MEPGLGRGVLELLPQSLGDSSALELEHLQPTADLATDDPNAGTGAIPAPDLVLGRRPTFVLAPLRDGSLAAVLFRRHYTEAAAMGQVSRVEDRHRLLGRGERDDLAHAFLGDGPDLLSASRHSVLAIP